MRGDFSQSSVRNVRTEICARVLAGASGACVILSVLAGFDGKHKATRRMPAAGMLPSAWPMTKNLFQLGRKRSDGSPIFHVTLATLRSRDVHLPHRGRDWLGARAARRAVHDVDARPDPSRAGVYPRLDGRPGRPRG